MNIKPQHHQRNDTKIIDRYLELYSNILVERNNDEDY